MPIQKLIRATVLALLFMSICNHQPVKAWTLWYVAPGGNDGWNCLATFTACRTIQGAINKAASGDSVRVEAGTYSSTSGEVFPITISNKNVILFGSSYLTTIVDATGSGQHVFSFGGYSIGCYLSGFTIQGGNRGVECIGYSYTQLTGLISNNRIISNQIGIYTSQSQTEISGNDISGNSTHGIYNVYSGPTIKKNIFGWNGVGGTSAAIYNDHAHPSIVNNLIGWNNGSGVFNAYSNPSVINNTISFNYGGSGVANFNGSSPQVTNNIITSNGVYGIHAQDTSAPTNSYNNVWANAWADYYGMGGGTGSISKDPRFVSIFDAHLLCSSPAINAGTNSGAPSEDYAGQPRPIGGRVDMGAYEKQTDLFCTFLPYIKK